MITGKLIKPTKVGLFLFKTMATVKELLLRKPRSDRGLTHKKRKVQFVDNNALPEQYKENPQKDLAKELAKKVKRGQ